MMKRAHQITILLICLLLLVTLLPRLTVAADAVVAEGSCGDNVYWTLSDTGILTISGSGPMTDYAHSFNDTTRCAPWYVHRLSITGAVIERGVTGIGGCAFYGCRNLSSVTIPEGITTIGNRAFEECTSLSQVTIPGSVTTIGWRAFCYCESLISVTIPGSVTAIQQETFAECINLIHVTIPEGVTDIGNYAFSGCKSLTDVVFPKSLTSIGQFALSNCYNMKSITFSGSAPTLGGWLFSSTTSTVYYPCNDETWSNVYKGDYQGDITWVGHTFGDYVIEHEATCTQNAIATGTCPGCGVTETVDVPGTATGHDYGKGILCINCGNAIQIVVYMNLRSGFRDWYGAGIEVYADDVLVAFVTEEGYQHDTEVRIPCAPCTTYTFKWVNGDIGSCVEFEISMNGTLLFSDNGGPYSTGDILYTLENTNFHQYGDIVTTPPTCTEAGFTTGTCVDCGRSHVIDTVPAAGHRFEKGICTVCGALGSKVCAHSYARGVWVTQPTCTEKGQKSYTCNLCGYVKNVTIPTTDHSLQTTKVAPNCTSNGYDLHRCENCDYSFQDNVVPPLGHRLLITETAPSCTVPGHRLHQCTNCPYYFFDNITPPTEHQYENNVCTACGARIPGDINGDGMINIADVAKLYAHIKGSITITDRTILKAADLNGDSTINIADVATLYATVKG